MQNLHIALELVHFGKVLLVQQVGLLAVLWVLGLGGPWGGYVGCVLGTEACTY